MTGWQRSVNIVLLAILISPQKQHPYHVSSYSVRGSNYQEDNVESDLQEDGTFPLLEHDELGEQVFYDDEAERERKLLPDLSVHPDFEEMDKRVSNLSSKGDQIGGDYDVGDSGSFIKILKDFNDSSEDKTPIDLSNENFTENWNITGDDYSMLRAIEEIGNILNFYYVPIIVLTGSMGNILSVVVFFKTKLRKLSSSYYLSALAISDTCFLLQLLLQWLNFVDINIYNRQYFCQFFTFMSSFTCFCSSWFVVAFTVERFIAVMYPLKRQTMCTVKRAKTVLITLTIIGILHCSPFILSSMPVYSPSLDTYICDLNMQYQVYISFFNSWDSFVVFAVPFIIISVLNSYTAFTVYKFETVRRTLTMQKMRPILQRNGSASNSQVVSRAISIRRPNRVLETHPNCDADLTRQGSIQQQKQQQQRVDDTRKLRTKRRNIQNSSQLKVTKMLLLVSTTFVVLNLPSYLLRMITFSETQTASNSKVTLVAQYLTQLLFVTNFGINFVLYCVSGQNFRKAVVALFKKVSLTQRDGNTQITVSEYYRSAGTLTRRRMRTQRCLNEIHEMHPLN